MHTNEAHQFIAQFAAGIAEPEAHQRFLGWLKGATLNEFNEIADRYDLLFNWSLTSSPPAAEWTTKLECRLDKALEGQNHALHTRA